MAAEAVLIGPELAVDPVDLAVAVEFLLLELMALEVELGEVLVLHVLEEMEELE